METYEGASASSQPNVDGKTVMEGSVSFKNLAEYDEAIIYMTKDDVMPMHFATFGDAEQFYKAYARVHGFGIRMDALIKNKHG